jgi:hypothetical protein
MHPHPQAVWIFVVGTLLLVPGYLKPARAADPPPIPAQEQPDVLTRGPVHEASPSP